MQSISVDQRRARRDARHRLARSARDVDDVPTIVRSVVVLHATDPATMVLSAALLPHPPQHRLAGDAAHGEVG